MNGVAAPAVGALVLGALVVAVHVAEAGEDDPEPPRTIALRTYPGTPEPSDLSLDVLVVTTHGSSSCPAVPVALDVDDGVALVTFAAPSRTEGTACSADMAPTSHELRLPPDIDRTQVRTVLARTHGLPGTHRM